MAASLLPSQLADGASTSSRAKAGEGSSQSTHCPLLQSLEQVQAPPGHLQSIQLGCSDLPYLSTPAEFII